MKSLEEYNDIAAKIASLMSVEGATTGSVYLDITDCGEDISPQEYVSAFLIALGKSLPETAILIDEFPAVKHIRLLSLENQVKHIRNEEPFELLVKARRGFTAQQRTYKQLNESDCELLFYTESGSSFNNVRLLEEALANPDREILIKIKL